jgi:hypothetical protein
MEWRHSGSPRPKNFRVQKSAGKVLASVFRDQDGILLIDYLPNGQTINYSSLLVQLTGILKEKRRGKLTKGVMFLHENVPAHRAPYLAPSDYHLFPGLKKTIERSPLFVRLGGHCCLGDLVGRTNFC